MMNINQAFFPFINIKKYPSNRYRPVLTVSENRKGVLDVDTIKGCTDGMKAYPYGGCYGECYAYKNAHRSGIDFAVSINRQFMGREHKGTIIKLMRTSEMSWYRIGVAGDPSHDWKHTVAICNALWWTEKIPVIVTKHWFILTDDQIEKLRHLQAVINTSTSGMDTDDELNHRVSQLERLRYAGVRSICRIVTCDYGTSEWARICKEKQDYLLSLRPTIDNPLRARKSNPHVINGDIILTKRRRAVGGGKYVSLHYTGVYLGTCNACPDQCGVESSAMKTSNKQEAIKMAAEQQEIFPQHIEFRCVEKVIGSGYEGNIAKLAVEDGIAHRAARKNIQIHSAIILTINGEFTGFFTFQNNHIVKEFCLLQSVIKPEFYTDDLYKRMVLEAIAQNTNEYPTIITTDPKSKFETPALFKSLGFQTYLEMSGFHYMVKGKIEDIRFKLLAHITMTNVWDSVRGEWLKLKKKWNEMLNDVGEKYSVPNPIFATREGCWQGKNGFANVVTGHSHNGNASVLDPVVCEVILRFFMPRGGSRIYNPFGGGVQFGFIAGSYGYEYVASEIRQNQCDANNKLCSDFSGIKWIQGDSSIYEPEGMFDLIFTCPPYYKVERYIDYDGNPPIGEINSLSNYEEFRHALFSGYRIAIDHLKDNCFFVAMVGDSRDKCGAFYCAEAETELFFKENGLSIYNKIVYLEAEFTRLAHAKKTLNMRKFPKREQKIIVAYKGNIGAIKDLYIPVGRL